MKRLLLLGVLAGAGLVPVAAASPAATHTLDGTVVAKDRAHHGLVVALPGGSVKTLVAPSAFGRTRVGHRVVIRYTNPAGRLPVALGVSVKGHARHALVRGTMVRLVKRHALVNAGGSLLDVTLKAPKRQRALASAKDGPKIGDTVKIEVEIDDDGSLDASAVAVAASASGVQLGSAGEMEVRGKVTALSPITLDVGTPPVSCVVPPGATPDVHVGDMIELNCDLIGGIWTLRVAHGENEHGSDDDSSELEARGVLSFTQDGLSAVVTPPAPGSPVTCTIPSNVLTKLKAQFAAGSVVKMECVTVGGTLTLKEIEKKGDGSGAQQGGSGSHDDNGDDDDDQGDDDQGDDDQGHDD